MTDGYYGNADQIISLLHEINNKLPNQTMRDLDDLYELVEHLKSSVESVETAIGGIDLG